MREEQAVVAEFVHAHGLETDGWVRCLDLVSELGELSKELLKVSDYGKLPLTATDAMKDELGDCMFSLLCLCGVLELDAKDALDGALAKYERRIAQYGEAGQRDAAPESR